jgi:hypothetical protein
MKYLTGIFGRLLFVFLGFYIPYAIFWQMPKTIGTHIQKNQYITQQCSNHLTLCQWTEGVVLMLMAVLFLYGLYTVGKILVHVFLFVFKPSHPFK